jgi:hypothetical protein
MLCEARTRVVSPLGGLEEEVEEPQARKLTLARTRTTRGRATLFKQEAPKNMKNGDLGAK